MAAPAASPWVDDKLVFDPGTDFDELDAGATATVVVDYTMSDASGVPSSAQVTITVTGSNDGPVAVADTAGGGENQTLTVDVLANDTDGDASDGPANFSLDSVSIASVTGLTGGGTGSVSIVDNKLVFNPGTDFDELDAGATATVVVDYTMSDAAGAPSAAQVTITVTGGNDGPVAVADTAGGGENQTVTVDVLANDTDVDASDGPANFSLDSVSVASVTGLTGGGTGSVSIVDNKLVFDPGTDFDELDAGATATVVVDYTMSDADGVPSSAQATITVTGSGDKPVAQDIVLSTNEDATPITASFIADDVDTGDTPANLTYALLNTPDRGTVVNNGDGTFSFDPGDDFDDLAAGEVEAVTFDYQVTDSDGLTDTASVTVNVEGKADINVIYAVDVSGSMGFFNNFGLNLAQNALNALTPEFDAVDASVNLHVVPFTNEDLSGARAPQSFDNDPGTATPDLDAAESMIDGLFASGGTSFSFGLGAVRDVFETEGFGDLNVVVFISDGSLSSASLQAEAEDIQFLNENGVSVFAVGTGVDSDLEFLDPIDNTGDGAVQITDADDLIADLQDVLDQIQPPAEGEAVILGASSSSGENGDEDSGDGYQVTNNEDESLGAGPPSNT